MISIISCSIDPTKASSIERHYRALLGEEPHEFIGVTAPRSLAEGYNRAVDRSRGDIIIFSHDDVEFLDPATWLTRLKTHLLGFDMIGLAGTTKLVSAAWAAAGPPYTFGQVGELDGRIAPFRALLCSVPAPAIGGMQAIDGLFMAARRAVLECVRFDQETFDGFHLYDVDFSFSAYLAGVRIAVAANLPILHHSQGSFGEDWKRQAEKFLRKRQTQLPVFRTRPFQHSVVGARTKDELLEILNGAEAHWPAQSC
jgi:hypothetical protein